MNDETDLLKVKPYTSREREMANKIERLTSQLETCRDQQITAEEQADGYNEMYDLALAERDKYRGMAEQLDGQLTAARSDYNETLLRLGVVCQELHDVTVVRYELQRRTTRVQEYIHKSSATRGYSDDIADNVQDILEGIISTELAEFMGWPVVEEEQVT